MTSPQTELSEPVGLLPTLVLTKTKVPPTRARLIRRTRLIDQLSDKESRQVTLVQAPAGYGKSTLLMQWAETDPIRRFGWVTLEKTENDPVLLWRYLLFALQALAPGVADRAHALLELPQPDLEAVASEAINGLVDIPGRLVLVLDDYHVITSKTCHESIQYFVDHLPTTCQIAFGTRTRPPLQLSKLASHGLVLELHATDMEFTFEETKVVLGRSAGGRSVEDVARIHDDTEGWPVGVYLSSKDNGSAEGQTSGGQQAIRTYLMEEMLDQLPVEERAALVDWSILPRFNGALADSVSGRTDSAVRLEQLAETNLLLITLDDDNDDWYRFHDLLRDQLRHEFDQRPREDRLAKQQRAMDFWLEKGDYGEVIHHALESGQYRQAAELIAAIWFPYMVTGHLETLVHWLDRIPWNSAIEYPPLLVAAAWVFSFTGDVEKTRQYGAAVSEASYDGEMLDGSFSYESAAAILRASLGHYGLEDANRHAEFAYATEPLESPWRPLAAALTGVTRLGLGRLDEAAEALAEGARGPRTPDGVAVYAKGQLGLLAIVQNDWDEASRHATAACEMIEELRIGNMIPSAAAQIAAAAAAAHEGRAGLAQQRLQMFARVLPSLSDAIPFDAFQLHLFAAETNLELGNLSAAAVHAREASDRLETFGDGGIFGSRLETVRLALEGHADESDDSAELTERELQILALLGTDLSLREIGEQLYVSRNTAKTHLSNVYRKLGVSDRSSAVARGQQLGLI